MTSIILAEPSILVGIPGILLILAVVLTIVIGGPLLLILYLVKRHRKPHPSPIPPVQPPSTERLLRKCSKCGSALNPDVPEGLCPACLLQQGIATEAGVPAGQPAFIPPTIPELAKLFPQLEIIEPIGKGGMGAVYKARQPALDRFVALKILAPRPGNELDFGSRFSREARALARLNHPNIVAVYDFGQIGGLSYFIMEYVDGRNLRQVQQAGRLAPREALEIIPQICAALQFAHDEGIVHRDIKPENVLLDRKGRVKIADFGLAKILGQEAQDFRLTGAKDVMGTPHYMAPEQVEKPQEVDHRADIFSLGVVFYEMLTGELPLGKFSPPSQKVQVDVRLDEVVLRALEKEPGRRYQQVSEVRTRLENIAGNPQASGTTPPAFAPANPAPPRRKSLLVTVIVLALVAALVVPAIVVGGFLFYREQQARRVQLAQQLRVQAELRSQAVLLEAQKQRELSQTNVPVVPAGSWSPTLADGEKPDLQKIRDEAKLLMNQGHYEDALQRYLWCFHHGREYGEFDVVRLSSGLSDWVELGRRYPKAKQALVDIRDADAKEFAEGRGYSDLFQEIQSLNRELQQDDATVVLFKDILKRDKALARQCYFYVEDALVENHEYELCARYMGDPQQRFESARSGYQMEIASHRRMAEIQQRTRQQTEEMYRRTGWTNRSPLFPNTSETMIRSAESRFVGKVRLLIEILVATDQHGAAEKIQAQALETLDDDRLKSAVRDAEKRTGRQPPVIVAPAQVLPPPTVVLTPAPPSREAIARDLSARFQAAKSIMSFTERDRALSGIARDAAASGHADITKKIVGEITSFVTRDDAARAAARLLAANGHRAEALEIARSITSFTTRDATLRELVDK